MEYKVKIPGMIKKQHAWIAHELMSNELEIIDSDLIYHGFEGAYCREDIPENWLTPTNL